MVDISNQMFWGGHITLRQELGKIFYLPKGNGTEEPSDFQPIKLCNADYKIMVR